MTSKTLVLEGNTVKPQTVAERKSELFGDMLAQEVVHRERQSRERKTARTSTSSVSFYDCERLEDRQSD